MGMKEGLKVYRFELKESLIKHIDYMINPEYLISRVIFTYQDLDGVESAYSKVDIRYDDISLAEPEDSWFNKKKYIRKKKKGEILTASNFNDYEVEVIDYSILTSDDW